MKQRRKLYDAEDAATNPHVVYGLFAAGAPRTILYVGSATFDAMPSRLGAHLHGECPTTRKMAAKNGIPLAELRMRIFCLWRANSPENHIMRLCQGFGMARWNHPYAFSSMDAAAGGRRTHSLYPEEMRDRGHVQGMKNAQDGGLARARANVKSRGDGWRKNIQSGQVVALGRFYGPLRGRRAVETGQIREALCSRWHGRQRGEPLCEKCGGTA
jgi:hypothetical protein